MKTLIFGLLAASVLYSITTVAQVAQIKTASSNHSRSSSSSSTSTSSSTSYTTSDNSVASDGIVALLQVTVGGLATWQEYTLEKRSINPTISSLEVMLQVGSQPSNYYIINPRIRGNWGIFSTDFRMNFLLEEGVDGFESIRTDDWQIIELNVLATRNVIGRIGGGILHENFSGGKTFSEWTTSLDVLGNNRKFGAMGEYRWAEVRKEGSIQFQSRIFSRPTAATYATIGVVYQQYYSKINVWGVQCGLVLRVF